MNHMDEDRIANALHGALRRQEAPAGFEERVLARLAERNSTQPTIRVSWLRFFAQPLVRWAAFAAVSTATILGAHIYQVRRERAEGEAAKQRLMLALRIAGSKLQLARSRVNEIHTDQTNENQSNDREVKE